MDRAETVAKPFFSVIINCHNSEQFIESAIDSVLGQSSQDYELIVFDNASTDDTAKIVKKFGRKVHYYSCKCKLSLGAARNQAIKKARGDFIAFLDSDDIWIPSKLEAQKALINERGSNTRVGLCASDAVRVSEDLTPLAKYSLGRIQYKGTVYAALLHDCFIPMSSAVVSRRACLAVGGFNEAYDIIEEWDLWLRIAENYEVLYHPQCLAKIRFHQSNTSRNYVAQYREIEQMLLQVELTTNVKKEVLESARSSWKVRYLIVDFISSLKGNNFKLSIIPQIFMLVYESPKASFAVFHSYFSIRLIRFAFKKYFTR